MLPVSGRNQDNQNQSTQIDKYPDECPFCHKGITPVQWADLFFGADQELQAIVRCPRRECQKLFVCYYRMSNAGPGNYYLRGVSKGNPKTATAFSQSLQGISPAFIKIFHEAEIAEQENLLEICGVGYRKAIEFLVKDYAIGKDTGKRVEIERKLLGACINDYIDDARIKSVASRATWLGNDETHYVRKWEGKNLDDLKALIRLTVHWLEMEAETKRFELEMPDSGPVAGASAN